MRIIGGEFKGLKLTPFDGNEIRPTADRVKESIFNILMFEIPESNVLDLFCGSGALGLESLSRGAKKVHFNDNSPHSIAVLTQNLKKIKGKLDYKVTRLDFVNCLNNCSEKYDIIFIDPPYASPAGEQALRIIGEKKLLSDGGVALFERDRVFEGEIEGLEVFDKRKYGSVHLTFFKTSGA